MSLPYNIIVDHRPWGDFRQFCHNQEVTVKIISVKPLQKLSVQRHKLRDEMWIALDEGLVATVDGETISMVPNKELWIPRGVVHTVECRNHLPSRFLEVAFGYFDEQDIERLEDKYGRV